MIQKTIDFFNDEANHKFYFIGLIFLLLLVHLGLGFVPRTDNHLLSSDGGYYYSYMRSFVMDGDFNIDNDIKIYNSKVPEESTAKLSVYYAFSIGPAILWTPFFLIARVLVVILSLAGISVGLDGYSYIEEWLVGAGSIIYVCIGLYMLYEILKKYFDPFISFVSVNTFFFATPLVYYTLIEPTMSHSLEFFSVCFFLWSLTNVNNDTGKFICSGIAGGLLSVVRWQNSILLILIILLFKNIINNKYNFFKNLTIFLTFMFTFLAIQSYFWKVTLGSYLTIPQGGGFLKYTQPYIFEVLFSTNHGLISWTPITLFGIIGFMFIKEKIVKYSFSFIFLIQLYVCSIVADWWCGDSFGMRRMIGMIPLMAIGFGALYSKLNDGGIRKLFNIIIFILICWNFLFILQYKSGCIPGSGYLSFSQFFYGKFDFIFKLMKKL